ncbi:hypothetical protein PSBY109024_11120 [Pseudoalteromonas byunsanensis]
MSVKQPFTNTLAQLGSNFNFLLAAQGRQFSELI